ncbi:MAG: pseudouridine synthase [Lentisphaeraceae bacterium]|nr:pseudouridine synthase [Lentisphaeraceae bacterium]
MSDNKYSTSVTPSKVWLPKVSDCQTIVEFMVRQFPRIEADIWRQRFVDGKVLDEAGNQFSLETPYLGDRHIIYYREVPFEEAIPFEEKIIFQNENFLIVDKPHFLPVHPAGKYVNETLVNRLKSKHGFKDIVTAHRLDRLTAGLILCILKQEVRGQYQTLFINGQIQKTYWAVGSLPESGQRQWHVKNCMEKVNPNFLMRVGSGEQNSESFIKVLEEKDGTALFELKPITGKKHQLRVHMASIGSGIENDPLYPQVKENRENDFKKPLKLLAKKLEFTDPFSGEVMKFESSFKLDF